MFFAVSLLVCLALIGLDQVIKHLVIVYLKPVPFVDVIPHVLRFRYIENRGAIFGSFSNQTVVLTVFSTVLLIGSVLYFVKNRNKSKFINVCLIMMISGGIGNIIDRIRLQYVVDFIEPTFVNFAVFNFADCLITVGAFALFFYLLRDMILEYKKPKSGAVSESSASESASPAAEPEVADTPAQTDNDGND